MPNSRISRDGCTLPGEGWRDVGAHCSFIVRALPTLYRLRGFFRREHVHTVNIHYPGMESLYFAIARQLGWIERLVLSFHGLDVEGIRRAGWVHRRLWSLIVRRADAFVGCSRFMAERASEVLGRPVEAIPNGISPGRSPATEQRPPGARSKRTILSVAALEHKKGIDVLLDAFEQLAARHSEHELVIVGRYTDYAETLKARIAEIGRRSPDVAHRIQMIPGEPHAAVLARMERAEIFVLPSRAEPFGLVILEAALAGAAIVASRVGGIPEIVDDGETALLVAPEDPGALAAAIERYIADPKLRRALCAALSERVRREFTWSVSWGRYLALVQNGSASTASAVDHVHAREDPSADWRIADLRSSSWS